MLFPIPLPAGLKANPNPIYADSNNSTPYQKFIWSPAFIDARFTITSRSALVCPYKVIIDNDRYSMLVNDVEVMWIADSKVYTPEIEVSKGFKLLDYLIEKDSSGNVNCEYIG